MMWSLRLSSLQGGGYSTLGAAVCTAAERIAVQAVVAKRQQVIEPRKCRRGRRGNAGDMHA